MGYCVSLCYFNHLHGETTGTGDLISGDIQSEQRIKTGTSINNGIVVIIQVAEEEEEEKEGKHHLLPLFHLQLLLLTLSFVDSDCEAFRM